MGLLTDPRAGNMKIIKLILKWERSLCFLMYISGVIWMLLLALPAFNDNTYFSENALLPGLVIKESNLEHTSKQFHQELMNEMKRNPNEMPHSWLLAKLHQLHLDVYSQNFTLKYPFKDQEFTGKNVYGIVRAPRAASTEAIVLSAPFRPLNSAHPSTAPSIALLLAFAKFCKRQKYWAKDIIFLITEHEQLGMQAWLDAYHEVTSGQDDTLVTGDLSGRAGSIQAAVNLELHSMQVGFIDVKVEGLNGQLPNLDLFNLAQNMIKKEDIRRSFQRRFDMNSKNKFNKWCYQFTTLMMMIATQATGVPNGNHGLFHRYGIEAITLEGFKKTDRGSTANFYQVGKVVESIVRSLNNLLERFHQSFFFYLLPSTDRYISIGLYIPTLVLIIGSLFIKAFTIWLRLQDSFKATDKTEKPQAFQVDSIASEILWSHIFGVGVMSSPKLFTSLNTRFLDLPTEAAIFCGFAFISILTLINFLLVKRSSKRDNVSLICVIVLVEFATSLMCIGMHNFSLAFLIGVVYVPIVLLITPGSTSRFRWILSLLWTLVHPFLITVFLVGGFTYLHFSDESLISIVGRGINAMKTSLVFSVIDSMIYGNWLYNVVLCVLFPIWILFSNIISTKTF